MFLFQLIMFCFLSLWIIKLTRRLSFNNMIVRIIASTSRHSRTQILYLRKWVISLTKCKFTDSQVLFHSFNLLFSWQHVVFSNSRHRVHIFWTKNLVHVSISLSCNLFSRIIRMSLGPLKFQIINRSGWKLFVVYAINWIHK